MFYKILCAIASLGFVLISWPSSTYASPLSWTKAEGIGYYSQEIRVAPSNPKIVFATLRNSNQSGFFKSLDGGQTYNILLPLEEGRDVNSIAISFTDENKLCIGTYEKGVFCSIDGGVHFSNDGWLISGLRDIRVRFIAVDPTDDNIFYAGTGVNNGDGGIYKSSDAGTSWTRVGSETYGGRNSLNIVVDKFDHNRVFAGADDWLFFSSDQGLTWRSLSLASTNSPATIIDKSVEDIMFSSSDSNGVYKSVDGGNTWKPKNVGIEGVFIFRLAQDDASSNLYASQTNQPGGVWRSRDQGETWENVGDPAWAGHLTWGLDAKGGRIFVSVEGLGIYYADDKNLPDPVVFLPGFGGSWSTKGLIFNQPTTYADWRMTPILAPDYYMPLQDALETAGMVKNQNLFTFGYDFRKSLIDSAFSLNSFLDEQVATRNEGLKIDIIAHSMGGQVARYCFEKIASCSAKIGKIITGGTPNTGVVDAYDFWQGAKINEPDFMIKLGETLLLHLLNPRPDIVRAIQKNYPGVHDLLPNFDYIEGKKYTELSLLGQNPVLDSLKPPSPELVAKLTTLSGQGENSTRFTIKTTPPNLLDKLLGRWTDGKSLDYTLEAGDATVLKSSSEMTGADNRYYPLIHKDYFRNSVVISDILAILGLPKPGTISKAATNMEVVHSLLVVYSQSPIVFTDPATIDGVIFVKNPTASTSITIKGLKDNNFTVNYLLVKDEGKTVSGSLGGSIKATEVKSFLVNSQ